MLTVAQVGPASLSRGLPDAGDVVESITFGFAFSTPPSIPPRPVDGPSFCAFHVFVSHAFLFALAAQHVTLAILFCPLHAFSSSSTVL
jgi:hypothetical protein